MATAKRKNSRLWKYAHVTALKGGLVMLNARLQELDAIAQFEGSGTYVLTLGDVTLRIEVPRTKETPRF